MSFGQYKAGQIVTVDAENGMPLDQYWRRRIKDAKENNCITVKVPNSSKEAVVDDKPKINKGRAKKKSTSSKESSKSMDKDNSEVSK